MKKIFSYSTLLLFVAVLATAMYSCKKEPGEGGAASIKGSVKIQNYNQVTHATIGSPYYAGREDIYIIYGDGTTYHDKIETSFDGSFEFRFLRVGKYKVYMYSDIVPKPASGADEEAVIFEVEITDKKGSYEIPVTTLKKY
ncbi:MAG: hypothetical protein ACHQF2_00205 [Flavobacteriales bacterium]